MKRILFINDILLNCFDEHINSFVGGGVEVLLNLYIDYLRDPFQIDVVLLNPNIKDISNSRKDKVRYYSYLYETKLGRIKNYAASFDEEGKLSNTKHNLDNQQYDVVFALKEGEVSFYGSKIKAKKHYAFVHTDYLANSHTIAFFKNRENEVACIKRFNHVICVSEAVKQSFVEVIGDPGNLTVMYNPLDIDKITRLSTETLPAQYQKEEGVFRFVMLGNILFPKGYDLLLEAIEKIDDSHKYEVCIIGRENNQDIDLMERLKKNMHIKLFGFMDNPYPVLKSADCFLSTSRYEGQSLSVQEAIVLEVPLLLTNVAGSKELILDSQYGILMEANPCAISASMEKVLTDITLHKKLKEKVILRKQELDFKSRLHKFQELI